MERFEINDGKFIGSYQEFGYGEVFENIGEAEFVYVVSFNMDNEMLMYLTKLNKNKKVVIISNIPNRFLTYYSKSAENRFIRKLNEYKKMMNPQNFKADFSTFFCFENHSKIVLTDKIAYVGSQNFSKSSKNNFEAGFITTDFGTIKRIKENYIDNILEKSINYYTEEAFIVVAGYINSVIDHTEEFVHLLHESLYTPWFDYPFKEDIWVINLDNVDEIDIENFKDNIIENCDQIIQEINDVFSEEYISTLNESYHNKIVNVVSEIDAVIEKFKMKVGDTSEDILSAEYFELNESNIAMEIFQEKYGLEGTDEKFDLLMELAHAEAHEIVSRESEKVEKDIEAFFLQINELKNDLEDIEKRINKEGKNILDNT